MERKALSGQAGGAWDFYTYWYHGHFVQAGSHWAYSLQGIDNLPFANQDVLPASLTPALIIVLSSFSHLPWPLAKTVWTGINVTLVLAIPWLVIQLLPTKLPMRPQILIALLFYGMSGISIAIRAGQPTILVFFLMLLALLLVNRGGKFLPGVILGLALSKFWLVFPLFLYFVYKRSWTVLAVSLGVQILGFVGLALLVESPMGLMISNYKAIGYLHAGGSYINLIHVAGHFPHTPNGLMVTAIIVSLPVFGALGWLVLRYRVKVPSPEQWDYPLFVVLNLWGLLISVHNQYDIGPSILGSALLISAMNSPSLFGLSSIKVKVIAGLTVVGLIGTVGIPVLSYIGPIPLSEWALIRWRLMTIGIAVLMLACLWLWREGLAWAAREPVGLPLGRDGVAS